MNTRACPYCAEEIQADAKKCKWCGEIVDPTLRAAGGVGGYAPPPPGYPPGAYPGQNPQMAADLADANSKANTALWCGIFGFCCFIVAIIAIVNGANANKLFAKHGQPSSGKATAGVVLGIIWCVLGVIGTIINAASGGFNRYG